MKLNKLYILTLIFASVMSACVSSGDDPGIEYAPQMYVSQAYEPYTQTQEFEYNPHGMTMRLPVEGTVARGQLNFEYPYGPADYAIAGDYTSDVPVTEENIAEGKRLFEYACWHCHGKSGKNDGPIFKSGKMPAPAWPNVQAEYIQNLEMGKMYHVITYGKGLMGSHAHILSPDERWKVIYHIKSMSLGDKFEVVAVGTPEMAEVEVSNDETPVVEE